LSFIFYKASIRVNLDYGELVKSCFDLFRLDLLKNFGFDPKISSEKEKTIWRSLQNFIECNEGELSNIKKNNEFSNR